MNWITSTQILTAASFLVLILLIVWSRSFGKARGFFAFSCRILWVLPFVFALFPKNEIKKKATSFHSQSIQVLIDDSDSMKKFKGQTQDIIKNIKDECINKNCRIHTSFLSSLSNNEKKFTFLNRGLESWFFQTGSDPWILITDGGDSDPSEPWNLNFEGLGTAGDKNRGLVIHPNEQLQDNIAIENIDAPPFAFEGQSIPLTARINRSKSNEKKTFQIFIESEEKRLLTTNVVFPVGQKETSLSLEMPPLSRGQHLVNIKIIPTADEKILWDNSLYHSIEVMPNTVGVLHLLGSPSWDGRYLRRYFKSEPKYDLISFFILRDPWDSQQVSERELSLIPFPVARLFNEELPNFRVIILQNFSLLQFLLPEYQKNLVDFVKNGGGLLFLGGDRSLVEGDLHNSPLKEILPFHVEKSPVDQGDFSIDPTKEGPWYDNDQPFKIAFANPTAHQRSLADVYSAWQDIAAPLQKFDGGVGLHHMEKVQFREGEYTPLLNAVTPQGESPLAVASYPGKGRALWVFSDSMWKLSTHQDQVSRTVYSKFMDGAFKWLLREEMTQPLIISNIDLKKDYKGVRWEVLLRGAAVRYFKDLGTWNVSVCGAQVDLSRTTVESLSMNEKKISGILPLHMQGGDRCRVSVKGQYDAFGSAKASMTGLFPDILSDEQIGFSSIKINNLIKLMKADSKNMDELNTGFIHNWVSEKVSNINVGTDIEYESHQNPYWFFKINWIWLFLCFLPLEVFVRKWHNISHQNI